MSKLYIVEVITGEGLTLYVGGNTPANANPDTQPNYFSKDKKRAYQFDRLKDAVFYTRRVGGRKRKIIELKEV